MAFPGFRIGRLAASPRAWTAALTRLRTDRLDIVHLHSCELVFLQHSGGAQALRTTVEAGKVRVAAYSGEGEALLWAVRSGLFGGVQCSVSIVDQAVLDGAVPEAQSRGIGVLAKRALGNAPWRFRCSATRARRRGGVGSVPRAAARYRRAPLAGCSSPVLPRMLRRIGDPHRDRQPRTPREAIAAVEQGPLDSRVVASIRTAYGAAGRTWSGRI